MAPRRSLAFGALCASVVVVACASPTLPLPPPDPPSQEAGVDADHIKLYAACGNVQGGAIVVIVNTNPNVAGDLAVSGALAAPCGSWDAMVYAHSGDVLDVQQEVDSQTSPPAVISIR